MPASSTAAILSPVLEALIQAALAQACARSGRLRRLVRGVPRPLVRDGRVSFEALEDEGMSYEELMAGLRKLGHAGPWEVGLAILEETGHVSAIPLGKRPDPDTDIKSQDS